ncbi:alpha,alpha-trehalose phosphorylase (configuration-retaining) [Nematocida sp. AWRm77]|nr:alpha,alpha-trehalose phosphorylase (configuration-retaining) [Nematocida sp. AWRm77]
MVHRTIFLGISTGISSSQQTLNLSITINDGFFVLGTKNYAFPIISNEECSPASSPSVSPQMSLDQEDLEDNEFEEIKGMHIDLKKKIVLTNYSTTEVCNNKMKKIINPSVYARIKCQEDRNGAEQCLIENTFISKLPLPIENEHMKDTLADGENCMSFEYLEKSSLDVLSNVLLVILDKWLGEYSKGNAIKIVGAGIATSVFHILDFSDKLKTLLWQKYDIHPCFFSGGEKPLDQQSESLARKCANMFGHANLPRLFIDSYNEVNVDGGNIWFCSLEDYRKQMGASGTAVISDLLKSVKELSRKKVLYFSSTPQGGGVALMRHALIRFFRMLGLSASWYVCMPSPSVFNITKKKIHNILQNVASAETVLTQEDKNKIDKWLKTNYHTNWREVIMQGDIAVLDDHQVARLVPLIRKDNPQMKIIYRSHIQIRSELLGEAEQLRNVWGFLWDALKDADYFISHPISTAVPPEVPREKVVFQPAGTDPIDGLNKECSESIQLYYQNVFNRVCIDNGETPVDFSSMYIVQVARFDPSKGFPDLLEAYYKLYTKFSETHKDETFSIRLVLCGHGSVDDPENTAIFKQISAIIEEEKYLPLKSLITKIQLPPSDQLLNVVLRGATVCCQLSVCEGYEVKVTESLMKKVPVIVYNTGGLPLQIINGVNGYVVEKGDTDAVSEHMHGLLFDKKLYEKIQQGINPKDFSYIFTPFQAMFWLQLFEGALSSKTFESDLFTKFKEQYWTEEKKEEPQDGTKKE